jgi:hypothetical protein
VPSVFLLILTHLIAAMQQQIVLVHFSLICSELIKRKTNRKMERWKEGKEGERKEENKETLFICLLFIFLELLFKSLFLRWILMLFFL